jgi:quercetin dioxygenase-like cupin family protein
MKRNSWPVAVIAAGLALAAGAAPGTSAIRFKPDEMTWKDGPPSLPPGTKIAVLEGDPKQAALFTMRVKLPAGSVLKPHTHPVDERVTVISGTVNVGFGDAVDKAQSIRFPAGSYYVNPPGSPHYLWSDEEVVLQLTNMGPWKVDFR